MIKKTITYKDLDGKDVTEDFYFNLSKADLAEMELSEKGGLGEYVKKIVAEEDGKKLVALFKDLLLRSVGQRSEDGRRFIKNQEIVDYFTQTNAYSELFIELATNAEQAAIFVNGLIPAELAQEVAALPAGKPEEQSEPSWITEGREPTQAEIQNATPEQLRLAFQRKQAANQQPTPSA